MSNYVKNFQKENNLKDDGIIGKSTLLKMKEVFNLNDFELSHILGQEHHESGGFKAGFENLNYSAKALLITFPKYFDINTANEYERQPERIANRVYANRMGNGDELSGMGWKYRGRGSLQLTGFLNYEDFTKYINDDCIELPDKIVDKYYFESGIYFFKRNNLFRYCTNVDEETIIGISKSVNLGNYNSSKTPNGLEDRIHQTLHYYNLLTK